jgi:hypothetical protein
MARSNVDAAGTLRFNFTLDPGLFELTRGAWPDDSLLTLLRALAAGLIVSSAEVKRGNIAESVLKAAAQRVSTPALAAAYSRQLAANGWDQIVGVRELQFIALRMLSISLWDSAKNENLHPAHCHVTTEQVAVVSLKISCT